MRKASLPMASSTGALSGGTEPGALSDTEFAGRFAFSISSSSFFRIC